MNNEKMIRTKFLAINPTLNELSRRRWVATEAKALGRGGVSIVFRATGVNRNTIMKGIKELGNKQNIEPNRLRKKGGGRKKIVEKNPELEESILEIVESTTRGDQENPLRYTTKSVRKLQREIEKKGYKISYPSIAGILHNNKFSLQANNKSIEGKQHPDRNAQFEFINQDVKTQIAKKEPVISVDAKKKELVGNFKNNGKEWNSKGNSTPVNVHDFQDKLLGKIAPYGVYDIDKNKGWINLGIDHDTAEFAVESIRRWWMKVGKSKYPKAKTLTITADSGGSNGYRTRLWKFELQKLSNQTGLIIRVRHFPPGTSKWNKIEHRLFSFISKNRRGKPLISHAVIINLISATKTEKGLKVDCVLDKNKYPTGIRISNEEYAKINISPEEFHGDWNYRIKPSRKC
ncbi:TPA: ISAzo13 family transposase [Candidatus Woesearchaeota archaeon]|nr:ISAzo13 family transposase [Candidatus Woesearchaeota archaeon]HII69042.1 ISAzo13 family transposase [Candidatus Woesearchaeota archaeon]